MSCIVNDRDRFDRSITGRVFRNMKKYVDVPFREASRGLMSKISMPCIFPSNSRRSRPVAWSRSVGMVPGLAPGGRRSSSVFTSI